VLEADPYQRPEKRKGYANGFKPKTVSTRLGELALAVPQVRGEVEFYPSALERGVRSERALKCALAEMYGQGVSTRKVTEVMRELCGLEVSSTQVSAPRSCSMRNCSGGGTGRSAQCRTCFSIPAMKQFGTAARWSRVRC